MRNTCAALALFALWLPVQAIAKSACSTAGVTSAYDTLFQTAVKRYLPAGYDWCWIKAWAMAESNLNPDAVSPVGAVGILQVMPATGAWVEKRYGGKLRKAFDPGGLKDAKTNIRIATMYIAHLHRFWSYPRPFYCRLQNMQASFNAGQGSVLKAQKLSGGRSCWKHIGAFLHKVTGDKHSEETISYVNTITHNYLRLKGLL